MTATTQTAAAAETDYSELIDEETWAFINKSLAIYPPESVTWNVEKNRAVYDDMSREFAVNHPPGVKTEDRVIGTVPLRLYECGAAATIVMYFHGGGFVLGGLESHDDVCADICAQTGYRVVSVDYRLAPEHKHPAAFDDCFKTTEWAAKTWQQPIVLAGDSAGGQLAAAVAHMARQTNMNIVGQVLIYPGLGGNTESDSYIHHANAPLLTRDEILYYRNVRFKGAVPTDDPTAAPLQDRDFTDLPATVIVSAECDPISDDGGQYRDKIQAAGGRAVWFNEAGLVHGYLRARRVARRAEVSFDRICAAIESLGQGRWPY